MKENGSLIIRLVTVMFSDLAKELDAFVLAHTFSLCNQYNKRNQQDIPRESCKIILTCWMLARLWTSYKDRVYTEGLKDSCKKMTGLWF